MKKYPFLLESLFISFVLLFVFQLLEAQQLYLFTNDSGTYLLNSVELKVPGDRTVFYSLWIWFLRDVLGIHFLFPVIFLPFWMVVYALNLVSNQLLGAILVPINKFVLLISTAIGIWISGVMWIVAQIMPDIFTSLMFLSWYLFTVEMRSKQKRSTLFWGLLMVVSCVMHNAHLLVILGLFILNIICNKNYLNNRYKINYKIFYILPFVFVMGSNVISGNGITLSKNAPVFLVAKMSENGLLKKYLDKNCEKEAIALCQFKDDLPDHAWDFIWPSDGIHMKVGGWYHTDSLYRRILKGIITDKNLFGELLVASFQATFKQVMLFGVGDGIIKIGDNATLAKVLNDEYRYHSDSEIFEREMSMDFSELNEYINFMMITLFSLFFIYVTRLVRQKENAIIFMEFSLMFVVFVLFQAFATGALANVLMRLNMRAIWLLIPVVIVFFSHEMIQVFHKIQIWYLRKFS